MYWTRDNLVHSQNYLESKDGENIWEIYWFYEKSYQIQLDQSLSLESQIATLGISGHAASGPTTQLRLCSMKVALVDSKQKTVAVFQ